MIKIFKFLLASLILSGCIIPSDNGTAELKKGRDPWIFRVNLDHMPRMLVLVLPADTWLGYDTELSRLYKTWTGGIRFNGPMYDDRHNVQPSSWGHAYLTDLSRVSPWSLSVSGRQTTVHPEYLGYRIQNGEAEIQYGLRIGSDSVWISERPFVETSQGSKILKRIFSVKGLPGDHTLRLQVSATTLKHGNGITAQGGTLHGSYFENGLTGYQEFKGFLNLNSSVETTLIYSLDRVAQPANDIQKAGGSSPESPRDTAAFAQVDSLEVGKKLITLSDCPACHQMDNKAIGPSYEMISKKYEAEPEIVTKLAKKIITGGSGVWGRQEMTAHPALSIDSAKLMVSYILSLDTNKSVSLRQGLLVSFYKPTVQLTNIPEFIPGQKPNFTAVVNDLEFRGVDMSINQEKNDFFEFDDQFVMYASGFIHAQEAGVYEFLIDANAGARLFLHEKKVAEVNYSKETVSAKLQKGLNPIRVEYFEDIYSSHLRVKWRKKGELKFRSIEPGRFRYDPANISATSPGLKEVYEVNAPGFGAPVDGVHPSFDVQTVRPVDFNKRLSALAFLPDGKLAVSTWDSTGSVYILENILTGDRSQVKARLFASGLYEVMGLQYVNGVLYALQKWELTALLDTDGDEVADYYKVRADDWSASANFHEWAFGLLYRDGYFYFNTGIGLGGNGVLSDSGLSYSKRFQTLDRGKTLKVSLATGKVKPLAHGLKAPNGIGFGTDEEIFVTDNEGHMVPTNKMMHVPQSGYPFFGNSEVLADNQLPVPPVKPPVLWMPWSEVTNSPSQPIRFHSGPYTEGQMIFGDVHHGGLKRAFIEKVNGEYQGVLFRFTQGLEAGINRITYGPDGSVYMAGLGAGGDFGYKGLCCGLQRLSFNGKSTLDFLSVKARKNGMLIEFTEPLRAGEGVFISDYKVQQFWYETGEDVPEGGVKNDIENIEVRSVAVSPDRKKVFLELEGLKKEHVIYIRTSKPFLSHAGNRLWAGEAWYTLNQIPDRLEPPGKRILPQHNRLLAEEKDDGWRLLFDGSRSADWKQDPDSAKWTISEDALVGTDGTLMLDQFASDFELEFEWKADEGAQGGLYYGSKNPSIDSAPQYRLGDESGKDLKATDLSGSLTGILGSRYKLYRPKEWSSARIIVNGNLVEHWVNGIRVLSYNYRDNNIPAEVDLKGSKKIALMVDKGKLHFRNVRIKKISSNLKK